MDIAQGRVGYPWIDCSMALPFRRRFFRRFEWAGLRKRADSRRPFRTWGRRGPTNPRPCYNPKKLRKHVVIDLKSHVIHWELRTRGFSRCYETFFNKENIALCKDFHFLKYRDIIKIPLLSTHKTRRIYGMELSMFSLWRNKGKVTRFNLDFNEKWRNIL